MQSKQVKQVQKSFDDKVTIKSKKFRILKLKGASVPATSIIDEVETSRETEPGQQPWSFNFQARSNEIMMLSVNWAMIYTFGKLIFEHMTITGESVVSKVGNNISVCSIT